MEGLNSMKFSEELFDEVKEIWDEYLKHPFVKLVMLLGDRFLYNYHIAQD